MTHRFLQMPRNTLVATVIVVSAGLTLLLRLPRLVVEGRSMQPTLEPGDRLVVLPTRPREGALVVLADPRTPDRTLVKRVTVVDGRLLLVEGDNPAHSTDSRQFGPVERRLVRGRPVYRYAPAERAGWVWRA